MNNLVSKNPVLRFKLGRKILFAKPGDKMLYNGKEVVTEETLDGQTVYRRKNGSYVYKNNKLLSPIKSTPRTISKPKTTSRVDLGSSIKTAGVNNELPALTKVSPTKKERTSSGLVAIKDKYIKNQGNTQYIGIIPEVNDINPQIKINSLPYRRKNKKVSTPSPVFNGHKIGKTGGLNYNINNTDKQQLIGTGQFNESDFTNALATQLALNRYFANSGLGSIKEDNAWGDQSRKALELALSKSKSLTPFNNETTIVKTPIVPTYTPPINLEIANLKLNVNVPQQTYDRTGVREFIRNKGINPYSFSGALRRALRMVLNNTADDNDKLLVKGMGLFKQGGLISRNPIERFKNGGVLKFQNAGNLPTAPKAEKRFRKNSYNTTKDGNRETTTITSQTFGYNRNWPYFRQPATILRIIEHGDTAFVETPEHHIFTKVLPRTALKSGNTYVEYNPKYDENYSLGGQANTIFNSSVTPLEYETLKRRFNIAWNLTK